eukprot:8243732-Lingulodinium_polyedra.AAC.1
MARPQTTLLTSTDSKAFRSTFLRSAEGPVSSRARRSGGQRPGEQSPEPSWKAPGLPPLCTRSGGP